MQNDPMLTRGARAVVAACQRAPRGCSFSIKELAAATNVHCKQISEIVAVLRGGGALQWASDGRSLRWSDPAWAPVRLARRKPPQIGTIRIEDVASTVISCLWEEPPRRAPEIAELCELDERSSKRFLYSVLHVLTGAGVLKRIDGDSSHKHYYAIGEGVFALTDSNEPIFVDFDPTAATPSTGRHLHRKRGRVD